MAPKKNQDPNSKYLTIAYRLGSIRIHRTTRAAKIANGGTNLAAKPIEKQNSNTPKNHKCPGPLIHVHGLLRPDKLPDASNVIKPHKIQGQTILENFPLRYGPIGLQMAIGRSIPERKNRSGRRIIDEKLKSDSILEFNATPYRDGTLKTCHARTARIATPRSESIQCWRDSR
ncbi:MAG: hypothetical protein Q4G34_03155 [Micrococcus sp.]|nr:hypothetical protein [Micrococcus sp.]